MGEPWKAACVIALSIIISGCSESRTPAAADDRPNILLIVADDMGYADIGAYGGDIDTPNFDALAQSGMLFTQFHTAPMCAPTRAMLLSGNNNHVAGMAGQNKNGLAGVSVEGYENRLSERIIPFPQLLRSSGYRTYAVGKWHLGHDVEHGPIAAGFERAWTLLEGGGSHFDGVGITPRGSGYRDGEDLVDWPEGRYSTDFYTDKLIEYINENSGDGKPFFAYAAYTSPHWPLQVPDAYLDLYAGRYDEGYDVLREQRLESLKEAGIIPAGVELPPRNAAITPWNELSAEEQRSEARKMELYAAMVDNLDDHIGRLLGYLRESGRLDNTIVIFMSDNGASGNDYYNDGGRFTKYIREHYDNAYEKMGTSESFVSYGPQWAEAGSALFQRYKGYTRQGGIAANMIIAGPGVKHRGAISFAYTTVMDLAPTFLDLAGTAYPDDGSVKPMLGASMLALLANEADTVHDDDYVTALMHHGRAFMRQGDWKLSTLERFYNESDFELFDLSVDPGETHDLTDEEPEKFAEMIKLWRAERRKLGIILPEDL